MTGPRAGRDAALLDCLGLSHTEETLYLRLLAEPGLSTAALGRRLDLTAPQLDAHLRSLGALGLTARDDEALAWRATAPDVALEALVRGREADLMRLRGRVHELMRSYRQADRPPESDELVEVVVGRAAIAACWQALQDGARTGLRILDRPPHVLLTDPEQEGALIRRGVSVQVIYENGAVRSPERLTAIRDCMRVGEEARMLPQLPFKLALVDDRWALLPVSSGSALRSALLVRRCSLLDALSGLFDLSWSQAMRVPRTGAPGGEQPDRRRRELLTLLAAGLTDDSIARHLGVSTRTVQRLVHDFMEANGARTRFQAGVQAARADLL